MRHFTGATSDTNRRLQEYEPWKLVILLTSRGCQRLNCKYVENVLSTNTSIFKRYDLRQGQFAALQTGRNILSASGTHFS
jgi:hypothetical protein